MHAQNTARRFDQVIVEGAKESVQQQHEKAGGGGGGGVDTQGAKDAVDRGTGQAKQALDKGVAQGEQAVDEGAGQAKQAAGKVGQPPSEAAPVAHPLHLVSHPGMGCLGVCSGVHRWATFRAGRITHVRSWGSGA